MMTMLALLLFFTYVHADCTYPHPIILYCYDIDVFPALDRNSDIVYIDIENTKLKKIPVFTIEHWPKLEFMTFRNNTFLPCSEIQKQKQEHIFYIDHDCIESDIKTKSTSKYRNPIVWIVIPICASIGSMVIIICINGYPKRTTQSNHDCAFQSV